MADVAQVLLAAGATDLVQAAAAGDITALLTAECSPVGGSAPSLQPQGPTEKTPEQNPQLQVRNPQYPQARRAVHPSLRAPSRPPPLNELSSLPRPH